MKYYLVYSVDTKGELMEIQGFTRDKKKAKKLCSDMNGAISEVKDLDDETDETHKLLKSLMAKSHIKGFTLQRGK